MARFQNHAVKYIDVSRFGLNCFPNIRHYSINAFSRYFIPEVCPHLGKVIYLDVDIIVKQDISLLYDQDLEDHAVGAVLEDFAANHAHLKEKIYPEWQSGDKYFNSGVLLLDIQKLLKNNCTRKLIDMTMRLYDKLACPDQDVLNILFENDFKVLDYKFNFMPDLFPLLANKHPEIEKIDPVIIHFTSGKPWAKDSCRNDDFWKVLKNTRFQKMISEKYNSKIRVFLFGFIPLCEIKNKPIQRKYYLFGCIPFLKVKRK